MIFRCFLQFSLVLGVFLAVCAGFAKAQTQAQEIERPAAPEIATGEQLSVKSARGSKMMAVTAHPDATKAAYDVLTRGGSAADAAIAAQMVLGLVEPQSSGLGGGGFVIYYDAAKGHVFTLDGRETAPSVAGAHLFMRDDGKPMKFYEAALGGRSVGTPGLVRMLEKLHEWQGRLKWGDLMTPAIELADRGFMVSERLNKMLTKEKARFEVDSLAKVYFYPDVVTPLPAGKMARNPDYALTLRAIAHGRGDVFYSGTLAEEMAAKVQGTKSNRGLLSLEDLEAYKVKERQAVCGDYRGYKICSMGQPSSGGLTLLMALGMVENFDLAAWGADDPKSWHVIAEASRLAFADRNQYMADPDFVTTPDTLLLQPDYLKARAAKIKVDKPLLNIKAGVPPGWDEAAARGNDSSIKPPGTSHLSIVDGYGNVLSMTTSIENAFGSRLMVGGFLLNNQLTDFSFNPYDENKLPVANRVEGGKRPRSSMTPTIIFDPEGQPFMAIGSAGGSRIIGYVLQRIISVIDWDMDIDRAIAAPHILHRGQKLELETTGVHLAEDLKNHGHPVSVGEMNSGLTAIHFKDGVMVGVADPRRDGIAMGE